MNNEKCTADCTYEPLGENATWAELLGVSDEIAKRIPRPILKTTYSPLEEAKDA